MKESKLPEVIGSPGHPVFVFSTSSSSLVVFGLVLLLVVVSMNSCTVVVPF